MFHFVFLVIQPKKQKILPTATVTGATQQQPITLQTPQTPTSVASSATNPSTEQQIHTEQQQIHQTQQQQQQSQETQQQIQQQSQSQSHTGNNYDNN